MTAWASNPAIAFTDGWPQSVSLKQSLRPTRRAYDVHSFVRGGVLGGAGRSLSRLKLGNVPREA